MNIFLYLLFHYFFFLLRRNCAEYQISSTPDERDEILLQMPKLESYTLVGSDFQKRKQFYIPSEMKIIYSVKRHRKCSWLTYIKYTEFGRNKRNGYKRLFFFIYNISSLRLVIQEVDICHMMVYKNHKKNTAELLPEKLKMAPGLYEENNLSYDIN